MTGKGRLEISEENHTDLETTRPRRRQGNAACTLSRLQVALCVTVVILLLAVMGILMAMFGPGSKDLKYRDPEDCKGKARYIPVPID